MLYRKRIPCIFFSDEEFISVENNLQKKQSIAEGVGIGLDNISKRYAFLSNRKVEIIQGAKSFLVKLPVLKENSL